jgi:uncharacterized protein (DUF433 family)
MSVPFATEVIPLQKDEHGVIRVAGTRVTLDTVIHTFKAGASAEEVVDQYPSLTLPDVYMVISYYLRHRAEVETYLERREREEEEVRRQNEAKFDPRGIREMLLARRNHRGSP